MGEYIKTNGRPPTFKDAKELEEAINEYFKSGVKKRIVLIGKPPNQKQIEIEVPTITGLCYYIGFASRQSFYDLQKKDEFSYTIKRARLFIEIEYEEQLSVGNTIGAIFALKNMGWKDKTENTQSTVIYQTEVSKEEAEIINKALEDEY